MSVNGLGSFYMPFGGSNSLGLNDLSQSALSQNINALGGLDSSLNLNTGLDNGQNTSAAPALSQTSQVPDGEKLMQLGQSITALLNQTLMAINTPPPPQPVSTPPTGQGSDIQTPIEDGNDPIQEGDNSVPTPQPTQDGSGPASDGGTTQTTTPQQGSQAALSQSLQHIDTSGVDQGSHGDCVFEASLASLASTDAGKQQISKMISVNPDGSYKVTFPGDSGHPVTVSKEEADKSTNSAQWAKVIEAAYIKAHPKAADGKFDEVPKGQTPAQWAQHLLTGNDASKATASDKDMGDKLDQAINKNHQSVVVHCGNDNGKTLVSGHEWTVTGYDPATKTVTVRNPWGHNDMKPGETKNGVTAMANGEMKMSLETFGKNYDEVTMVNG
jgi:hypothetical protein